jgi:hypothetical protein
VQKVRLTHPELGFWVDVRLRECDGRWLAVADLADEPDIGLGASAAEAVRGALDALGTRYAAAMAKQVTLHGRV